MGTMTEMIEDYLRAFNAGDIPGYTRYYANDVELTNGAGDTLRGADRIAEYYLAVKDRFDRKIELLAAVEGDGVLAVALHSRFRVLADATPYLTETLDRGDEVDVRTIVLYEFADGKFARIRSRTIDRQFIRKS